MVRAARIDPCRNPFLEIGFVLPHQPADGEIGHLVRVFDEFDLLHDEAHPVAHVDHGDGDRLGRGDALENEARGIGLAADAERVHLNFRLGGGELRRNFEHVRTEAQPVREVVGVVLHQTRALLPRHVLHDRAQRGDLPVALRAEAVALALQILNGEPGELVQPVQRAEMVDDADVAALVLAEFIDGDFVLRLLAHDVDALGTHRIFFIILRHHGVHFLVGHLFDVLDEVADGIVIDLPAEADVRLHLVALGDGDVAHVIGEAADLDRFGESITRGDLAPDGELFERFLVLIVTDDDLVVLAQAGDDIAELPVAVRRLVFVHEVHVDGVVRQLFVVLGRKVAHGLLQHGKPLNPHFRGRESVAPGDDADAVVVRVDLLDRRDDLVRALAGSEVFDGNGHALVHIVRHLLGVLRNMFENVRAVQRLGTCQPINDFLFHFLFPL